jgi:uncharacterized protein (DUF1330 family)
MVLGIGGFAVSVYLIIDIEVYNPELYNQYMECASVIVARYGGRYLVRGGAITPLSGTWHPERIVLIEFESMERLQACFGSAEYREVAPLRENSTHSRSIVVEGL